MTNMREILAGKSQPRLVILAADRNALPRSQALFGSVVGSVDSGFAQVLSSELQK